MPGESSREEVSSLIRPLISGLFITSSSGFIFSICLRLIQLLFHEDFEIYFNLLQLVVIVIVLLLLTHVTGDPGVFKCLLNGNTLVGVLF
jgi:hypothetical protein